ncbi:MAG: hypothetical protein ACTHK1_02825 [Actinomycetales bacterium]
MAGADVAPAAHSPQGDAARGCTPALLADPAQFAAASCPTFA